MGDLRRAADGEQHVTRFERARRARRAGRHGDALVVELQQHGLALHAIDEQRRDVRQAGLASVVALVFSSADVTPLTSLSRSAVRRTTSPAWSSSMSSSALAKPTAPGVFCVPRSLLELLAASALERVERRALLQVQRAETLGAVDLVAREGRCVHAELLHVEGDLARASGPRRCGRGRRPRARCRQAP